MFLGGVIAVAGQIAGLVVDFRKWRKEKLLEHLRSERDRLQTLFEEVWKDALSGATNQKHSIEVITKVRYRCPRKVLEAYLGLLVESDRTPTKLQGHHFAISAAMNEALAEVDRKIEAAL